ncbi:hypothetical protein ACJX0J_011926 [Zea mays]
MYGPDLDLDPHVGDGNAITVEENFVIIIGTLKHIFLCLCLTSLQQQLVGHEWLSGGSKKTKGMVFIVTLLHFTIVQNSCLIWLVIKEATVDPIFASDKTSRDIRVGPIFALDDIIYIVNMCTQPIQRIHIIHFLTRPRYQNPTIGCTWADEHIAHWFHHGWKHIGKLIMI